jgi:type II secretory pathway pseudopilin PulG
MTQRRAFSLVEASIVVLLAVVLIASAVWVLLYGARATQRTGEQLSAQQTARAAVARLLRELQEGIEVVSPPPGSTYPYAVVRDQVSCARWYYLIPQAGAPGLFELWRHVDDADLTPDKRAEKLLANVKRLTFTAQSEGAVQVNLMLKDGDQEFPLLTSVRMRNLAAADDW